MTSNEQKDRFRLEAYRTSDDLRRIRADWESLLSHPNGDPDVFLAGLEEKSDTAAPHIVLIYNGDRPVALLTATIETVEYRLGFAHWTLACPRLRTLLAPMGSLHGELSPAAASLLADHVVELARSGAIDAARFWDLPTDSPFYTELVRRGSFLCRDRAIWHSPHRTIPLPRTWEEYLALFRSHHRRMYLRRCQMLEGENPEGLSYYVATRPEDVDRFCEDAEAVARKTFQRRLNASFRDGPATRRRLRLMAEKGLWRGYVLLAQGTPCAYWYGTRLRNRFYTVYTGYDPAISNLNPGPGTSLMMKMLEDLCRNTDVTEIDFGPGEEGYKKRFCPHETVPHAWMVHVFAPRPRPMAVNGLRTLLRGMERAVKSAVKRLGVRERMRAAWRRRIAPETNTKRGRSRPKE